MSSPLTAFIKPLSASRENRLKGLRLVEEHPEYVNELFELAHNSEAKREHIYASWIWEFYILNDFSRYPPFFDSSLHCLMKIENSSMRRSHSKILWHFLNNKTSSSTLTKAQKEWIISICLCWIITETKTAPLSFCIRVLLFFRSEFPEIHSHLEDLLLHSRRTFPKGVYPIIRSVFKN